MNKKLKSMSLIMIVLMCLSIHVQSQTPCFKNNQCMDDNKPYCDELSGECVSSESRSLLSSGYVPGSDFDFFDTTIGTPIWTNGESNWIQFERNTATTSSFPLAKKLFVADGGDDSTGSGTDSQPYHTIGKALSDPLVATTSPTSPLIIYLGDSTFTEDVVLPPNVYLIGSGSEASTGTVIQGSISLTPSLWSGSTKFVGGLLYLNIGGSGSITLDFLNADASGAKFHFFNVKTSISISVPCKSVNNKVYFIGCNLGTVSVVGGSTYVYNSFSLNSLVIVDTSSPTPLPAYLYIAGGKITSITLTSTVLKVESHHYGVTVSGAVNSRGTSPGVVNMYSTLLGLGTLTTTDQVNVYYISQSNTAPYTPSRPTDWKSIVPIDLQSALDNLAFNVYNLKDLSYTPSVLTGWDSTVPTTALSALDSLRRATNQVYVAADSSTVNWGGSVPVNVKTALDSLHQASNIVYTPVDTSSSSWGGSVPKSVKDALDNIHAANDLPFVPTTPLNWNYVPTTLKSAVESSTFPYLTSTVYLSPMTDMIASTPFVPIGTGASFNAGMYSAKLYIEVTKISANVEPLHISASISYVSRPGQPPNTQLSPALIANTLGSMSYTIHFYHTDSSQPINFNVGLSSSISGGVNYDLRISLERISGAMVVNPI